MVSLATQTDRTLFFDFLPIDLGQISGFTTRFQLYRAGAGLLQRHAAPGLAGRGRRRSSVTAARQLDETSRVCRTSG
jgi:hypothetical protein